MTTLPVPDTPPPPVEGDAPWDQPYLGEPVEHWMDPAAPALVGAATRSFEDLPYDELGLAALDAAIADLYVRETSTNWGPEIEQYLANVGIDYPANWCAAAVHYWIKEASEATGIEKPIKPTGLAKGTMYLLDQIDRWVDKEKIKPEQILPGMILVWTANIPDKPWRGHIGLVERMDPDGETIHTVEGNVMIPSEPGKQGVARLNRKLSDVKLLGFGVLSGPRPWIQMPEQPPSSQPQSQRGWTIPLLAAGAGVVVGFLGWRWARGRA